MHSAVLETVQDKLQEEIDSLDKLQSYLRDLICTKGYVGGVGNAESSVLDAMRVIKTSINGLDRDIGTARRKERDGS